MMEIEESDLLVSYDLAADASVLQWDAQTPSDDATNSPTLTDYGVLKHKITSSPIIEEFYNMKYSTNKKIEGLGKYNTPEDGNILLPSMLRELRPIDPDSFGSQLDDYDDLEEEMLKFTTKDDVKKLEEVEDIEIDEVVDMQLEDVIVNIHRSAISIQGCRTFEVPSTIRSSALLPGATTDHNKRDEDTLLLSLSSNLLLMVRLFIIDGTITPYVVQWWRTNYQQDQLPQLTDVGKSIITHQSGGAFAVTALKNVIRLHTTVQTPRGAMIDKLKNVVLDGTILFTCFLDPIEGLPDRSHAMICSMVLTSERRLLLRLFEWWIDEERFTEHTPLPLTNDFQIPIFVIPFKDSVFMMFENVMLLVSINNILSADFNFIHGEFQGSFPVCSYRPKTPIIADSAENEVLIGTEDGTIYSIVVYGSNIHVRPILRVPRCGKFTLEKMDDGYHFIYISNVTNHGHIIFKDVIHDANSDDKLPVSKGELLESRSNWAPLWDTEVVDLRTGDQELWLAHGRSISKLKQGICAVKEVSDRTFRSAVKVFSHQIDEQLYLIITYVDKTLVFKYEGDTLSDIIDSGLDLAKRTLYISSFDEICFQVTEDSIVVSDFENEESTLYKEFFETLVYADVLDNIIAVVMERPSRSGVSTVIRLYHAIGEITPFCDELALDFECNFIKLAVYENERSSLLLFVAADDYLKVYTQTSDGLQSIREIHCGLNSIHDMVMIDNTVHTSSRDGEYMWFTLSGPIENLQVSKPSQLKLSETPIEFELGFNSLLLITSCLWILPRKSVYPVPVVFEELRDRQVFSAIHVDEDRLAVLRDDGLCIVRVDNHKKTISKSIKLGVVPRKFKYISHIGVFAIITETGMVFTNKFSKLEHRFYAKSTRGIFEDDLPLCVNEWILPSTEKKFRNLLVGCSTKCGGSLKVLSLRTFSEENQNIIDVTELYRIKTTGAVLSVAQLEDGCILFSSGSDLFSCQYNLTDRAMHEPIQLHSFKSLVTQIHVQGNNIVVCTQSHAVSQFTYEDGLLRLAYEDVTQRKASSSILFDKEDLVIVADKLHCTVSGLSDSRSKFKSYQNYVATVKQCQLKSTWYKARSSLNRFIAFGIGGNIELFTVVNQEIKANMKKSYRDVKGELPSCVTQKGFWRLEKGPWYSNRDVNVFDADLFKDGTSGDIVELLESVAL